MESTQLFNLVPWVVFLPLIGLGINLLVGRRLGEIFAGTVASLATGLAFVVSILLAVALTGHPEGITVVLADWITIGDFTVPLGFPRGYPFGDDDAGGLRCGHAHPHLLHRLHAQ